MIITHDYKVNSLYNKIHFKFETTLTILKQQYSKKEKKKKLQPIRKIHENPAIAEIFYPNIIISQITV